MNFRLTKLKVIISIIVIVAWYIYIILASTLPQCGLCPPLDYNCVSCPKVFTLNIIPDYSDVCYCDCYCPGPTPISKIFRDLGIVFLPGILTYVIWSFFQRKKR